MEQQNTEEKIGVAYATVHAVCRNHYGDWQQSTTIPMANNRELEILTMKRSSGNLLTTASVAIINPSSNGFSSKTFEPFGDMNETLIKNRPSRVTSKVVEAQHAQVDLPEVYAKAIAFYEAKDAKDAAALEASKRCDNFEYVKGDA